MQPTSGPTPSRLWVSVLIAVRLLNLPAPQLVSLRPTAPGVVIAKMCFTDMLERARAQADSLPPAGTDGTLSTAHPAASRRSGLEFNERPPAEQAADFFYRRFRHTLKVCNPQRPHHLATTCKSPAHGCGSTLMLPQKHKSMCMTMLILSSVPKFYRSPATRAGLACWIVLLSRRHPTVQVDKAVVDALASALEKSPEAGSAALRAAVRRHAIVDVQV